MKNRINEELSVNNELEMSANDVCNGIISRFGEIDNRTYARTGVTLSDGTPSLVSSCSFGIVVHLIGRNFKCVVKVFIFNDKQTMMEYYNLFDIGGEFDQGNQVFSFSLPCVANDGLDKQFMHNTVYHELEHSLQYIKLGDMIVNNAYKAAISLMYNKIPKFVDKDLSLLLNENMYVGRLIATLYYFFYPKEMDANINGLYGELLDNGIRLRETNYFECRKTSEKLLSELLSYCESEEINKICSLFGFGNIRSFIKYINRQMKYLERKERKVVQRAMNAKKLNESARFISPNSRKMYLR